MGKLNDLLSNIITRVNNAATKNEVSQLSAEIDAIGTQEDIVQQVIAALGTPVFGRVEEDKTIVLTAKNLVDGSYPMVFEEEDGTRVSIGTYEKGPKYTNLADPTSADWLTNKRLNSSGVATDSTPSVSTNYIPLKSSDTVRIRHMEIRYHGTGTGSATTHFYDENKTRIGSAMPANNPNQFTQDADGLGYTFNMSTVSPYITMLSGYSLSDIRYARFVGRLFDGFSKEDVIITVNQEIPA